MLRELNARKSQIFMNNSIEDSLARFELTKLTLTIFFLLRNWIQSKKQIIRSKSAK
jgi:hypothetical protein